MNIYKFITLNKQKGNKLFAVLIDPDKQSTNELVQLIEKAVVAKVDLIFVGSLLTNGNFSKCITTIKSNCSIPLVIFQVIQCKLTKMLTAFCSCR